MNQNVTFVLSILPPVTLANGTGNTCCGTDNLMNLNPFWSMSTNTGRKVRERSSSSALKANFCQVHPTHKRAERQKNRIFRSSQRDPHTLKVSLVWSVSLIFSHKDSMASLKLCAFLHLLPSVFSLRVILEDWNCGMGMFNLWYPLITH